MTFRYFRRIPLGKGLRINLSKTGIGLSAGIPGMRYSIHSSGRRVRTVGLPGTGLFYRKDDYPFKNRTQSHPRASPSPAAGGAAGMLARPGDGVLPPHQLDFVNGVRLYDAGEFEAAAGAFARSRRANPSLISPAFFEAFAHLGTEKLEPAAAALRLVVESDVELPDQLMDELRAEGHTVISVLPTLDVNLPFSSLAAALLLAEVYQQLGDRRQAAELLESLGSVAEDPVFALAAADIYSDLAEYKETIRVSDGFTPGNEVTRWLFLYRADAFTALGLPSSAVSALGLVLADEDIEHDVELFARFARQALLRQQGELERADADLDRVWALDPTWASAQATD